MATIHNNYDLSALDNIKKQWVKKDKRAKREYLNIPISYDIEVSSFEQRGERGFCVYSHAVAIFDHVWHFRTWDDIIAFFDAVVAYFAPKSNQYIVLYVHNLAYEYNFIRNMLNFQEVFANGSARKIGYARTTHLEFRCSYMESSVSLLKLSDLTKVKKLKGDLDYLLIRSPLTKLTQKELGYIYNDVLVLTEYVALQMEKNGDISQIPYTHTGYVRREVLKAFRHASGASYLMKQLTLTPSVMSLLRETYHGGFVHANANYAGKMLRNIGSFDATSFYPTQFCSHMYPMSKPTETTCTISQLESLVDNNNVLVMFEAHVDVTQKGPTGTYSVSRATDTHDIVEDNGRIVSGSFTGQFTDADWRAFRLMYDYEILSISRVVIYAAGYLPAWFIHTMLKFYETKTRLKGVAGEEEAYAAAKGLLNSFYGMCATDPIRDEFELEEDGLMAQVDFVSIEEATERINKDKKRFTYYPWAVWNTAYAQESLFETIDYLQDDWVYSDTDSDKVANPERHLAWFAKKSEEVYARIRKCLDVLNLPHSLAFAKDQKGNVHPLGEWTYEGKYDYFKTLGAKRYMTLTGDVLTLICSGVSKQKGAEYIAGAHTVDDKGRVHVTESPKAIFDRFNDGLIIPSEYSGRTIHHYIDMPNSYTFTDYQGQQFTTFEMSGIVMEPADYHLGISENYAKYLQEIATFTLDN